MMPHTVLIVDDEKGVRTSVRGILEDAGFQAVAVSSGEDALLAVTEKRFPVVLLDVWLPGMDGLEALSRIRETSPESIVIMISGHGSPQRKNISICIRRF